MVTLQFAQILKVLDKVKDSSHSSELTEAALEIALRAAYSEGFRAGSKPAGENVSPLTPSSKPARGMKQGKPVNAKLDEVQVRMIRSSPDTAYKLAGALGVSVYTIYNVRRGKTWKNVPEASTAH